MGTVHVVGSVNLDVVVRCARHPRPGETVPGSGLRHFPGGKGANQAVAAARMGVPTTITGRVGEDDAAATLLGFLGDAGVDVTSVAATAGPSGTALIVVDDAGMNSIVVVPGANGEVTAEDVRQVRAQPSDVVITQLEVPDAVVTAALVAARDAGATTILNPSPVRPLSPALVAAVDLLVLNAAELGALTGCVLDDDADVTALVAAAATLDPAPALAVVATLGARGCVAIPATDVPVVIAPHPVVAVDTTGAGDCFAGVLAAALSEARPLAEALWRANLAAALCVQRDGAGPSMPTRAELQRALASA